MTASDPETLTEDALRAMVRKIVTAFPPDERGSARMLGALKLMGGEGMLYPERGYDLTERDAAKETMADLRWQYLRSRAGTIEGGTSEIQRNVLAERVLGLPKEPTVAHDRAARSVR
jgi:hypothetical protein